MTDDEINAACARIAKAREESMKRLESSDPAVVKAEHDRIVANGVKFVMGHGDASPSA